MNLLKTTYVNLATLFNESICVPKKSICWGQVICQSSLPIPPFPDNLSANHSQRQIQRRKPNAHMPVVDISAEASRSKQEGDGDNRYQTHPCPGSFGTSPEGRKRTRAERKLMSTPEADCLHQASDKDNCSWPNVTPQTV